MSLYNFEINKEACFFYWIQSSIEWNWYFNQKEYDKWIQITGIFTDKEKKILKYFKDILQKENNGYTWLWDRYVGNKTDNNDEIKKIDELKKILENKFNILWKSEYPKLLQWKKKLEKYDLDDFNDDFKKIHRFFGVKDNRQKITVSLCFGWGRKSGGNVKREFPNNILLTLSNSDMTEMNQVLKTLFHENIHLIEYSSNKNILFKKSYEKIIIPLKISKQSQSWRHLIIESIISSIVGIDVGYLDRKIGIKDTSKKIKVTREKNKIKNYGDKIKNISKKISKLTERYIRERKTIDKDYSDFVLNALKKVYREKETTS